MICWVVYDHPVDYPDSFVARRFVLDRGPQPVPTEEVLVAASLAALRQLVRQQDPNLVRFYRSRDDEPQIVECWM